jgi:catechol 2,3-dioxygenase-like lactoylglutathione lyase family enzyme
VLPSGHGEFLVRITSSAVSLNVEDVAASSSFWVEHLGFREEMAAEGFASLRRQDAGMNVVFLRRGLLSLPADQRDDHAGGVIVAFVVDDLEGELARLQGEGVAITMPLIEEEWGERAFQVRDPNGVIIQLVDWNATTGGEITGEFASGGK